MIHEGINHIPCCQVHADHFNGSDDSCQLILVHAFPCDHCEVFIGAIVAIPVGHLSARGEVSTVLIISSYDLEVRLGAQRCDLPGEG